MDNGLRLATLGECMLELSELTSGGQRQHKLGFGGDTLNTAVYLAREMRGTPATVSFVTALGDDPFSDEMVASWAAEGIDTSLVRRFEGALPGLYAIRTNAAGERSFYYWREQAAVRSLFDEDGPALASLRGALRSLDLLYLSGITLAIFSGERRERLFEVLEDCSRAGVSLAFDTNYRPALWQSATEAAAWFERLGPLLAYVLPSLDDDLAVFGPTAGGAGGVLQRWHDFGAPEVVLKAGAGSCHVSLDRSATEVPVPAPVDAVDTTAAGDSFAAAYLAARMRNEAPVEAALAGHRLAARVIRHHGAIVPVEG